MRALSLRRRRLPMRQAPAQVALKSFPAPLRGLWTNVNPATQQTGTARVLDNYWPTARGIRPREGSILYATIDAGGDAVGSMWVYRAGGVRKLFASDSDSIFDITAPADEATPPAADVSGLNSGIFSTLMFEITSGAYQYCLNESSSDNPRLYDGSSWTEVTTVSSPALTGVTPATLRAPWSHGKRLWFVEEGTTSAWYLPTDSIGGALTEFSLAGLFPKGGELLFGTTWSLDTGAGLDDKCVFVSTTGDVVVYSGTDPSSASTWSLEGSYSMAEMLGRNAHYKVGGTPFFATVEGIIAITEVISVDRSQQKLKAVSYPIEDQWLEEIATREATDWTTFRWEEMNMLIVTTPVDVADDDTQYFVMNTATQAWARWKNWDATCGAAEGAGCYLGTSGGTIYQIEVTGADAGTGYACDCVLAFDHLDAPGGHKTVKQARANFRAKNSVKAKLSASINYGVQLPSSPASIADFAGGDVWDTGLWDTALWDTGASGDFQAVATMWQSIGRSGFAHAIQVQQYFGISAAHYSELMSIDVVYERGGVVV